MGQMDRSFVITFGAFKDTWFLSPRLMKALDCTWAIRSCFCTSIASFCFSVLAATTALSLSASWSAGETPAGTLEGRVAEW